MYSDRARIELAHRRVKVNDNFPSNQAHRARGLSNVIPDGELIYMKDHPKKRKWRIYRDLSDREWLKVPWYFNMFHKPWAQRKFIYLDRETLESGVGSSEVQMNKKTGAIDNEGSYNYRDFSTVGHFRHFLADILPVVIYFHR